MRGRDNLEFLQWLKRFWDSNYGGHAYDAVARRKGIALEQPATIAPLAPSSAARGSSGATATRAGGRTPLGGHRAGSAQPEVVLQLQNQVRDLSSHLEGLEKERDFYFEKLRAIEILVQQQMEVLEAEGKDDDTLKEIQKILYSTEVRGRRVVFCRIADCVFRRDLRSLILTMPLLMRKKLFNWPSFVASRSCPSISYLCLS